MSAMERWPRACVDHLRFNADGLIPAITQDWLDGAVLMLAWMTRPSLLATVETGQVHYWSARARLRPDGRTSGGAITAAAGLDAACQQLTEDWHQGVDGEDLDHALALLDALQQGLAARGFSWRDVLKKAKQSPLQ